MASLKLFKLKLQSYIKKIKKVTDAFRYKLKSSLVYFSFKEIDLKSPTPLGAKYELGHICGKYYFASELPDNQILINDLRNLIGVYRELKGILCNRPYEDIVKEILEDDYSPLNLDDLEVNSTNIKYSYQNQPILPKFPKKGLRKLQGII